LLGFQAHQGGAEDLSAEPIAAAQFLGNDERATTLRCPHRLMDLRVIGLTDGGDYF
jgi:hypothetical protein